MIIGVWIAIVMCIAVIAGEAKYRWFGDRKQYAVHGAVSKDWEDYIDEDIYGLSMEDTDNEFVRLQVLAMRGSWRLARDQVMGRGMFHILREQEYAKML